MGLQINLPFIQNSTPQGDLAYGMLGKRERETLTVAGKMLTTLLSLLLGMALVNARQTLVAKGFSHSFLMTNLSP
jgi:hypothetical protein